VRFVAFVVLASCAPVVAPASLPLLKIDPSLKGAVLSREAAEAVATKRLQYEAWCDQRVTDCETTNKILRRDRDEQRARADRHVWWSTYGPGLLGGGIAASFLAGVALTLAILAGTW
jgi:hypothetical protein